MFLSRVRVATEGLRPKSLHQLMQGNAYGNHQLLWQLFPNEEGRSFLYRQEQEHDAPLPSEYPRGMPLFYVLSQVEPEEVPGLLACESKPFAPRLQTGQHLGFRLRANPVVARREEGRKNSRHHDVLMDAKKQARAEGIDDRTAIQERMDDAARAWLQDEDRASRNGYRLVGPPQVSGYRQHTSRRKGKHIRFSAVDFEGILEITDPTRFQQSLAHGIGRSRAFGCGMWMIRRA